MKDPSEWGGWWYDGPNDECDNPLHNYHAAAIARDAMVGWLAHRFVYLFRHEDGE